MSLTSMSGAFSPEDATVHLPSSRPERFLRSDFIAAALVFAITLGVYVATLAPSVTLGDSGELITGAVAFGVPHPPGYPLWALSGFIFSHLFPFGSLAWRINLMTALFGAAANAVLTLLVCHSGRWMLQRWADAGLQTAMRPYCFYVGLTAGLVLGFSDVMWGQSVIAEVYSLNALFVNLVLLLFYFWMLEPQKTGRLILTVFVFALGLTNHHTLIQIIPAILLAAALVRGGQFWSVLTAVNLFSLSILVYLSWLSADDELHAISARMAVLIFLFTALLSFFHLTRFRWSLFGLGTLGALACVAYGHYVMGPAEEAERIGEAGWQFWRLGSFAHPGWLQITGPFGIFVLLLAIAALGLLATSQLNRRLIAAVFALGWIGLMPYAYESFASSTHPPMNWGCASERAGFYYAVSREQYPMSLPNLIKTTLGRVVQAVPASEHPDPGLDRPHYFQRLCLTLYYYVDNLRDNFTVPLIMLTLAVLIYLRRCDWAQGSWLIFLAVAFFFLGFMLHLIEPQESFDFEHNLQYKVFHLQSHCIFVLFFSYGLLAGLLYLRESVGPEARFPTPAFGMPALCLSLLPLWSNFDDCNQAGHWFGYDFGADMMRTLEPNAVFLGGSDPGRFVPTYMAFVESQQPARWKRDPSFDRRDVAVITQNALCDSYYTHYIRDQYDARFRPTPERYTAFEKWLGRPSAYPVEPVTCVSPAELSDCWDRYRVSQDARIKSGAPLLRPNSNDVFELNGVVAREIFEKNKKKHTFYLEQSIPIEWMYPYLLPDGLVLKLNPESMTALPAGAAEKDRRFWDTYSARLLSDRKFHVDDDARISFGRLAFWHADLYRWRSLPKEQEYWLKIATALCPQLEIAVDTLARLYEKQGRLEEAVAIVREGQKADPRNPYYQTVLDWLLREQIAKKAVKMAPAPPVNQPSTTAPTKGK